MIVFVSVFKDFWVLEGHHGTSCQSESVQAEVKLVQRGEWIAYTSQEDKQRKRWLESEKAKMEDSRQLTTIYISL